MGYFCREKRGWAGGRKRIAQYGVITFGAMRINSRSGVGSVGSGSLHTVQSETAPVMDAEEYLDRCSNAASPCDARRRSGHCSRAWRPVATPGRRARPPAHVSAPTLSPPRRCGVTAYMKDMVTLLLDNRPEKPIEFITDYFHTVLAASTPITRALRFVRLSPPGHPVFDDNLAPAYAPRRAVAPHAPATLARSGSSPERPGQLRERWYGIACAAGGGAKCACACCPPTP